MVSAFRDKYRVIMELIYTGNFESALSEINSSRRSIIDDVELIELLLLESRIQNLSNENEIAYQLAKQAEKQATSISNESLVGKSLVEQAEVLWRLGKVDDVILLINRIDQMHDTLDLDIKGKFLNIKGNTYGLLKGDYDTALKSYYQSLEIRKQLGDLRGIAASLNNIGEVFRKKGEFNQALQNYQKSLETMKEANNQHGIALVSNNIGETYLKKGELEKGREYFEESLKVNNKQKYRHELAHSLAGIASIYAERGDQRKSISYFEESLTHHKNRPQCISQTLFTLIQYTIKIDNENLTTKYMKILEELNSSVNLPEIDLRCRLLRALVLKNSTRFKNKIQALTILEEIIHEEIINHHLTILAMKHYCEFLLDEVKLYGDPEAFVEAKDLVGKLQEIAQSQNSFNVLVEALILRAKFAMIEGDLESADVILEQANLITIEKDLPSMQIHVENQQAKLKSEVENWQQLVSKNATMAEKIDQANLIEYIQQVQKYSS